MKPFFLMHCIFQVFIKIPRKVFHCVSSYVSTSKSLYFKIAVQPLRVLVAQIVSLTCFWIFYAVNLMLLKFCYGNNAPQFLPISHLFWPGKGSFLSSLIWGQFYEVGVCAACSSHSSQRTCMHYIYRYIDRVPYFHQQLKLHFSQFHANIVW